MINNKIKTIAISLFLVTCVSACSGGKWGFPYRAPVQQGNWVTEKQIAYLKKGMTKEQVVYALGNPVSKDVFHEGRWDYRYEFKPGFGEPVVREFSVWFDKDNKLSKWEGDKAPSRQPSTFESQQVGK